MMPVEFQPFLQKPCRFRFKSGKDVFGVIWEDRSGKFSRHYFASSYEYANYIKASSKNDNKMSQRLGYPVNIEEVVVAEHLR